MLHKLARYFVNSNAAIVAGGLRCATANLLPAGVNVHRGTDDAVGNADPIRHTTSEISCKMLKTGERILRSRGEVLLKDRSRYKCSLRRGVGIFGAIKTTGESLTNYIRRTCCV